MRAAALIAVNPQMELWLATSPIQAAAPPVQLRSAGVTAALVVPGYGALAAVLSVSAATGDDSEADRILRSAHTRVICSFGCSSRTSRGDGSRSRFFTA